MTERSDLESQAAALLELQRRRREFPLYYYEYASAKTCSFHKSTARTRILAGGNRSGKTEANVAELAATALGYRPWVLRELGLPAPDKPWVRPDNLPEDAIVFNGAGIRIQVPSEITIVSGLPSKKGIGEVVHPKLKKLLGSFIEREYMSHGGVPGSVILKNGSRIHYASSEMEPMAFEGTAYSSIFIDEPIPKRIYTALKRASIDHHARTTLTFTPIGKDSGWVFRDLYQEKDPLKVQVFNTSIYDNKFLSLAAIEEFASDPTLSEIEKQARLYGRFQFLADRIYSNFNEDVHVVEPFRIPEDWYHGMVIDPATIKPWAIAYFAISPDGRIFFHKEWPTTDITRLRKDGRTISDYAQLLHQLDADHPIQIRLADPNYTPRSDSMRGVYIPSILTDIARFNIHFDTHISDDLEYGESKVRQMLAYNDKLPVDALNRPRLFVFNTCRNLIASLSFYSFRTKIRTDNEPDEDKREETFKDFADCLRYTCVRFADVSTASSIDDFQTEPTSDEGCYGEPDLRAYR